MTEQDFRDALKRQVGQTGLSSDRQAQVLAGMKGRQSKVRVNHWFRFAVVVAVVLVLCVTGAAAGGRFLVDWQGEKLPDVQLETDQRMWQLKDWRMKGKWASILKWNEEREKYTGILAGTLEVSAASLTQLRTWVMADGTLPWPENIPEVYQQLRIGTVEYACEPEGEIRLRNQETTEDGYIISYFDMPKAHRFVKGYYLYLKDDEGHTLLIQMNLIEAGGKLALPMQDGDTFMELRVDGMLQAAAIESAGTTYVALRQAVQPALTCKSVGGYPDGVVKEWQSAYECLEIIIIGDGTPDDLLAIFGLTAE